MPGTPEQRSQGRRQAETDTITTARCRSCIQKIGELNPRPLMNTESCRTEYVVPDIKYRQQLGIPDSRLRSYL